MTPTELTFRLSASLARRSVWPLSRWYHRRILRDRPADAVACFLASADFWCVHHYWPTLQAPKTVSEKIVHRMLFSRDPILTVLSDKLASREYISSRVGAEYLVPIIWSGVDPDDIPFSVLPEKFVIKATHGCGYNIIVKDKRRLDEGAATAQLRLWLRQNFASDALLGTAWGYKHVPPRIIVEPFIGEGGVEPVDYKFFCYDGRALFVDTLYDRFGDGRENFFDRDYNLVPLWNGMTLDNTRLDKPANYDTMLRIADRLSEGMDFVRVDEYSVNGQVFVGELTCYPAGGRAPFVPREYDFILGRPWHLPTSRP